MRRQQLYSLLFVGLISSLATAQEFAGYSFVPLAGSPHDVVYDQARELAYVSNRSLNRIDVISIQTQSLQTSIPVSSSPRGLAVTPDGQQLLVTLYDSEQMAFIDLQSNTETRVLDLPPGLARNYPLRVDFDAAGSCIWRDGGSANPYGYAYKLNLQTDVSTRLLPLENDLRYTSSFDGSKFLFMFDGDETAVWDAGTQSSTTPVTIPGFGHSWGNWITQGTINIAGDTIALNRGGPETLVYDGAMNYQGTTVGMAWGTCGPWDNLALIVEAFGDESPKNKISILDTEGLGIVDTITLPETIGIGEYNFGSNPIALTDDAGLLLAVGQTGLFIIDTQDISVGPKIVMGPVYNPETGNMYYLLERSSWTEAQAKAEVMGGNLVTINDGGENAWVCETFGQVGTGIWGLWIGLNDAVQEGLFVWASGEPVTYTQWEPSQPDNLANQDHVQLWTANAQGRETCHWDDYWDHNLEFPICGVVEVVPEAVLLDLEIVGPSEVAENFQAQYQAIAHYEGGSSKDVTDEAVWSVEPDTFSGIAAGLLQTGDVEMPQEITISVQYSEGAIVAEAEKAVTVLAICPSGTALQFDGINDSVEASGYKGVTGTQSRTVSAWIKTSETGEIICWGQDLPGQKWILRVQNLHGASGAIRLEVSSGYVVGSTDLRDDAWHHVAAVLTDDGSPDVEEIELYVDGNLEAHTASAASGVDTAVAADVTIGVMLNHLDRYFTGKIDEVCILNRALSPEEIWANMRRKLTVGEDGLVAYWDFDEGDDQVAGDSSGNGNDGQLGSSLEEDDSDPAWVESDAPVGICNYVVVDIKPGSCPNPLNLNSKGVLPVAILGSQNFDVNTIDPASVFLEGVSAIHSSYEDVAGAVVDGDECECTEEGPDGFDDLTFKFRTQEIVDKLVTTYEELAKGQILPLRLTGEFYDGARLQETDCVELVGNVPKWLAARDSDINEDGIVDMHDLVIMANYWLESASAEH